MTWADGHPNYTAQPAYTCFKQIKFNMEAYVMICHQDKFGISVLNV